MNDEQLLVFCQHYFNLSRSDYDLNLSALIYFRRSYLSSFLKSDADQKLFLGLLSKFIDSPIDHFEPAPRLQLEALKILTNLACRNEMNGAENLIETGAAERILKLIDSRISPIETRLQGVWCLGNIAANDSRGRNYLLKNGALNMCVQLFWQCKDQDLWRRDLVWTIKNLCLDRDRAYSHFQSAVGVFHWILDSKIADQESIIDSCLGLQNLTKGDLPDNEQMVRLILNVDIARLLIDWIKKTKTLKSFDQKLLAATIGALGNLILYDDQQMQMVLDAGALSALREVLSHACPNVAGRTCWILSNVAAGNGTHRRIMFDEPGLMATLILEAEGHVSFRVRQEAVFAICHLLKYGDDDDFRRRVLKSGCLDVLCQSLRNPDIDFHFIKCIVDTFEVILRMEPMNFNENVYSKLIMRYGGDLNMLYLAENFRQYPSENDERAFLVKWYEILLKYF